MTDLVERARFLAACQGDPHSATIYAHESFSRTELCDEIERLRTSLSDLLGWVDQLPVKHPQQATMRAAARALLSAQHEASGTYD